MKQLSVPGVRLNSRFGADIEVFGKWVVEIDASHRLLVVDEPTLSAVLLKYILSLPIRWRNWGLRRDGPMANS